MSILLKVKRGKAIMDEETDNLCSEDIDLDIVYMYAYERGRDSLIPAISQAVEAMEMALRCRGQALLTDPPQDAWKYLDMDDVLQKAIDGLREVCFVDS